MKQYKDLNLKKIREALDIDFAHFTYLRGQCSCCYGPKDLPKRYWKDGIIKYSDYTYALFKNADNGSGIVSKNDYITNYTCISWDMSMEKAEQFCEMLQEQLDTDYLVLCPKNTDYCIQILCKSEGLFKLAVNEIARYQTGFDMTEIRKLQVAETKYVYFDNEFKIKKSE